MISYCRFSLSSSRRISYSVTISSRGVRYLCISHRGRLKAGQVYGSLCEVQCSAVQVGPSHHCSIDCVGLRSCYIYYVCSYVEDIGITVWNYSSSSGVTARRICHRPGLARRHPQHLRTETRPTDDSTGRDRVEGSCSSLSSIDYKELYLLSTSFCLVAVKLTLVHS